MASSLSSLSPFFHDRNIDQLLTGSRMASLPPVGVFVGARWTGPSVSLSNIGSTLDEVKDPTVYQV